MHGTIDIVEKVEGFRDQLIPVTQQALLDLLLAASEHMVGICGLQYSIDMNDSLLFVSGKMEYLCQAKRHVVNIKIVQNKWQFYKYDGIDKFAMS